MRGARTRRVGGRATGGTALTGALGGVTTAASSTVAGVGGVGGVGGGSADAIGRDGSDADVASEAASDVWCDVTPPTTAPLPRMATAMIIALKIQPLLPGCVRRPERPHEAAVPERPPRVPRGACGGSSREGDERLAVRTTRAMRSTEAAARA
jgi:hypothetical protein